MNENSTGPRFPVLVLNCGSSSIKYQLLDMPDERLLSWGLLERIGLDGSRLVHDVSGRSTFRIERSIAGHKEGIDLILETLVHPQHGAISSLDEIRAVGHRVVHAGTRYTDSVIVTSDVIMALHECSDLAPLHNPANIAGIEASTRAMPHAAQVAVFDTGLHHTLPQHAYIYALPRDLIDKYQLRRYGFHGIAIRWATERASHLLNKPLSSLNIVTLMLGSGCTANAMKNGVSVDVSTGFTPLEGLIQSTRSGDVDPALVLYIMEREKLTLSQMSDLLNRESGWKGLSKVSPDLRQVIVAAQSGDSNARLALDAFAYRCRKYVGAYTAAMGGVDALIFTGGIGEKSPQLRERICDGLQFLELEIDADANRVVGDDRIISKPESRVQVIVVSVNEELVIARDTMNLCR